MHYPKPHPPRLADRLLEWLVAPHQLESLLGDLHEEFAWQVERVGERRAKWKYWREVLGFIKPRFIRRPKSMYSTPNTTDMLRNYLKIALRNLVKNKAYSAINIGGLALGMACALLIFLVVGHETSYDCHHSNGNRVYRVETENISENHTYPGTYTGMVNALHTDLQQAELVVPLLRITGSTFRVPSTDKQFKESFVYAGNELFHLLDYRWVAGDFRTALKRPNTVVISRSYAEKYFGTTDVINTTINLDSKQDLVVVGVLDDYPTTTSFAFDLLVSFPTIKQINPDMDLNKWNGWSDNFQVFVLLRNGIFPTQLTQSFQKIVVKYMGKEALADKRFLLNPLSQLHYTGNLGGRSANLGLLKTLSFVSLLVLLIACFNFINLNTAQAFKRAKEVGVRKAVGSNRRALASQFLAEAGVITFLAALIAILLAFLAVPSMAETLVIPLVPSDLFTVASSEFIVGLTLVTTLLAGIYPALRLSGMSPIWSLKTNTLTQRNQGLSLRQGLVVFQFTISLILISSAFLINRQLTFFQNADLGFDKSAIITIGLPDNDPGKLAYLRNQITGSPRVDDISFSFNSASAETNWMQVIQYQMGIETTPIKTQMKMGDSHFLDTYGIQLLAGEKLRDSDTSSTAYKVIANEVFLNRMGLNQPSEAIGQKVYFGDGNEFAIIIGVVKNFNVNSLHQKIDPTLIQVVPNHFYQAGIKLQGSDLTNATLQKALAEIEAAWTETFPNHVFEYSFLSETLAQAYQSEIRTARLIEVSTFLAVLIACLGLYGLAIFMTEQRTKEIGVRKVLGASVTGIIALLSKDFLKLVLVAFVLASPIAWYVMSQWLQNFEFKVEIEWWMFAITGLLMTGIAFLTVGSQAMRAALMNPVKSLRSE